VSTHHFPKIKLKNVKKKSIIFNISSPHMGLIWEGRKEIKKKKKKKKKKEVMNDVTRKEKRWKKKR